MERALLICAAAALAASWIYILFLKATIRDYASYIHQRIEKSNQGFERMGRSLRERRETEETGNPLRVRTSNATSSRQERNSMAKKPQLIIDSPGNHQSVFYRCSHCWHEFPLPDDQPPKQAVRELMGRFREHVAKEHADIAAGSDEPTEE